MSSTKYDHCFSHNYTSARALFIKTALAVNAEYTFHKIAAQGIDHEELAIDVATLGAKNPEQTVIITTALHGIEGFIGSALLTAWLEEIKNNPPVLDKKAIVLVHALNPYGFSFKRRVNENNVDLNRNFIRANQKFAGASPELNKIPWMQHPVSVDSKSFNITLSTLSTIMRYGFKTLRNALLQGQFEYPDALFFGGRQYEETTRIVQNNINPWTRNAPNVLHLDFHSGIGKFGECHLLTFAPMNAKQTIWLQSQFGTKVMPIGVDLLKGGKPDGIMVDWIANHFEAQHKNYAHLVVEFGTHPAIRSFKALYQENRFHLHPGAEYNAAQKELMEIFFPSDKAWRHKSINNGLMVISKAIAASNVSIS